MPTKEEIALQRHRWLGKQHVGAARPVIRAFVRKGHLERRYRRLPDNEVFGYVPGLMGPNDVWYGEWIPDTKYVEIPNVKEAKGDQDYSQNGIEQVTLVADNIAMIEKEGHLSALFHTIERGYYSPQRGYPSNRGERAGKKNEWFDVWKGKSTQIIILMGYGDAVFPLHCGLIDKSNLTSRPDSISMSIRSMGQFFTDQHIFMDAKNLWLRDPITFADRVSVQEGPNVANTAQAKSERSGAPASLAVDGEDKSAWVSGGGDDLQWIEFPLPAGHYIKLEMNPGYEDMEMFVSVFVTNKNVPGGGSAHFGNGDAVNDEGDEGWAESKDHVPGTTIPYLNQVPQIKEKMTTYPVTNAGRKIISGDGTKVRLWFKNLHNSPTDDGHGTTQRAAVREVRIRDASVPEAAAKGHWILIDDVSDIVKIICQWCGFHDWEIETCGVRLSDKVVFDRQKFLIDPINYLKEQVGYVFYVKPPPEFDLDDLTPKSEINRHMGVPVFRQQSVVSNETPESIESVRDDNLLTGVNAEFDANVLPDSIRVRGKAVSDKIAQNDPAHIHALGADRTKRYQASYRPVWARKNSNGAAHLRRPEVNYDYLLSTTYECEVACLLIAMQAALESAKGEIEIPLWPIIFLDNQVLLFDRGTGTSTRIWIVQRSWNFSTGAEVEAKMTLGGSFIDINDIAETRDELAVLLNQNGRMPHPIARGPWTEPVKF